MYHRIRILDWGSWVTVEYLRRLSSINKDPTILHLLWATHFIYTDEQWVFFIPSTLRIDLDLLNNVHFKWMQFMFFHYCLIVVNIVNWLHIYTLYCIKYTFSLCAIFRWLYVFFKHSKTLVLHKITEWKSCTLVYLPSITRKMETCSLPMILLVSWAAVALDGCLINLKLTFLSGITEIHQRILKSIRICC